MISTALIRMAGGLPVLMVLLTVPSPVWPQQPAGSGEPEEPDYFFLTGGPYTQKRNSPQIIWANQWFRSGGPLAAAREYAGAGRFEWGVTDRWEADFEFGVVSLEEKLAGVTVFDESGAADLLFGVRYRLLDESFAPFTLTLGSQVVAPAASRLRGLGTGEVGYAVDVAAAKDWGGLVFMATSVNAGFTPEVPALPDGSGPEFDLSEISWAAALGLRALERPATDGASHDLHVFAEIAGARSDEIDSGARVRSTAWVFAPGLRYGYVSRSGSLTEVGVSFPVGLNDNAPDWGVIVQFQFEVASIGAR